QPTRQGIHGAATEAEPVKVVWKPALEAPLQRSHDDIVFPACVSDDGRRVAGQDGVQQRGHGYCLLAGILCPLLDFSAQIAAVVEPVGPVDVDDLDLRGFGVYTLYGVGMVADDMRLAEEA